MTTHRQTLSCSFVDGKSVQWAKEQSTKCAGSAESVLFLTGTYSSMFLAMCFSFSFLSAQESADVRVGEDERRG